MPAVREAGRSPFREFFRLGPPVVERMGLESRPSASTVSSYVLTRAAELAWRAINGHLEERGGRVFWVSGPSGCGKTHFLNYVLALQARAGSLGDERGRRLGFGLEVAGRVRGPEIEAYLLEALAEHLSPGDRRSATIWREVRGAAAIKVALESARRIGVVALTAAIDFGAADSEEVGAYFTELAETVADFKGVRLTLVAASRGRAPEGVTSLEVGPAEDEATRVAVGRARLLNETLRDEATEFYREVELGGLDPLGIFPFHPEALGALSAVATPPGTVAAVAVLAREALISASDPEPHQESLGRLIYPADLPESPGLARRLEACLGEDGAAALAMAREAMAGMQGNEQELAHEIISTLVLKRVADGPKPVAVRELAALLPILAGEETGGAWTTPVVLELLRKMASRSRGVLALEGDAARFDPAAAGAPEIAAFNAALALARRFDSSLGAVHDARAMEARVARLARAMADAVEAANRTAEKLRAALATENLALSPEQERTLGEYVRLAEQGPSALVEAAQDPWRRQSALKTITEYETLAQAAAMVPRMRAMREYLDATGLRIGYEDDCAKDPATAALETECQLLRAELTGRLLLAPPRNLDALEARFQKFKWTYVHRYRSAHEEWKAEMERLGRLSDDLRSYLDALRRLNAISALGAPEEEELPALAADMSRRVVRCGFEGPLAPELTPRCPGCGFVLGISAPRTELSDLLERARRALDIKFAALSQSAVARIIREHDHGHRLEGFLKITQAAQTDALARVLDDKLARYLARLLDDNLGSAGARARGVVQPLDEARFKASPAKVAGCAHTRHRALKMPTPDKEPR